MMNRVFVALGLTIMVGGCSIDRRAVEGNTEGYAARGFGDLEGPRSEANLDPPLGYVDHDQQLVDHMARQKGGRDYDKD